MKINNTQARILILCRVPRRPEEVWKFWENDLSYNYITSQMAQLYKLGLMEKRNLRAKGQNKSFYTALEKGLNLAEELLKNPLKG